MRREEDDVQKNEDRRELNEGRRRPEEGGHVGREVDCRDAGRTKVERASSQGHGGLRSSRQEIRATTVEAKSSVSGRKQHQVVVDQRTTHTGTHAVSQTGKLAELPKGVGEASNAT